MADGRTENCRSMTDKQKALLYTHKKSTAPKNQKSEVIKLRKHRIIYRRNQNSYIKFFKIDHYENRPL